MLELVSKIDSSCASESDTKSNNPVCVFLSNTFEIVVPRSPTLFSISIISFSFIPSDFFAALNTNFSETPNSIPSKSGLNFP